MKRIPFYPNHTDNMHCQMAVYASVIDYFLDQKLTWKELEKLVGYRPGIAAWTVEALPKMAAMGLDIRMIEPFDYPRYALEGDAYLQTVSGQEELDWYYQYSNIREMKKYIPEFLRNVKQEVRRAQLSDIDAMLQDGRLVFITVNSRALNNKPGYFAHAILITDKVGNFYITHDSGLPPKPNRKITADLLWKAMGGDANTSEVTGFKLAKNSPATQTLGKI